MSNEIVLQVRLNEQIYENLQKRAKEMGFTSAPGYVRFWATAEVNSLAERRNYQDLRKPTEQALRYIELLFALRPAPFLTMDAALNYAVMHTRKAHRRELMREKLDQLRKQQADRVA